MGHEGIASFFDPRLLTAWILYALVLMSLASLAVFFERLIFLSGYSSPLEPLNTAINRFGQDRDRPVLLEAIENMGGFQARILVRGLSDERRGPEATAETFDALLQVEKLRLERGLAVLGTVGANAPFVGLLGTVLGVMKAFRDLSTVEGAGLDVVGSGISEALIATAVGLLVAILAVIAYNLLQRRVKVILSRAASLQALVVATLRQT